MIDAALLDVPIEAFWTPEGLLPGFLEQDGVLLWRYADEGPPADAPGFTPPWSDQVFPLGWVVARPATNSGSLTSHDVTWTQGTTEVVDAAIMGDGVESTSRHRLAAAYLDMPSAAAAQRREADALALHTASTLNADLYITSRPALLQPPPTRLDGLLVCDASAALQVVSLYLRSRGKILISANSGSSHTWKGAGAFYWRGALNLLPAGPEWSNACASFAARTGQEKIAVLPGAAFQRVANSLQARDDMLRTASLPQDLDTADEALRSLDFIALSLMAALDVLARVAHHLLGIPGSQRNAGWQRKDWRGKLEAVATELAALVEPRSSGHDVLTIVSSLRNTIHAEGLRAISVRPSGGSAYSLVGLPSEDQAEILAATDRLGGRDSWGLKTDFPGDPHSDPIPLAERLIVEVLGLLTALMSATTRQVANGGSDRGSIPPATKPGLGMNGRHAALSIQWQLGLEPPEHSGNPV